MPYFCNMKSSAAFSVTLVVAIFLIGMAGCKKQLPDAESTQNVDSLGAADTLSGELTLPHEDDMVGIWPDGTYTAAVTYVDPENAKQQDFTLKVHVLAGEVVEIEYPGSASLDRSEFDPALLDAEGYAEIETETGKLYKIQVTR